MPQKRIKGIIPMRSAPKSPSLKASRVFGITGIL